MCTNATKNKINKTIEIDREFKKYSMTYLKMTYPAASRSNFKKVIAMFLLLAYLNVNGAFAAMPVPAPPNVAAKNYLLIDFASGKVLAEKNVDVQIEPASITKLMTAYVIYKELDADRLFLDDLADISEKAWRMGGSRMYLDVNTSVTVRDLLKGLIIQSGNDASIALAEHVAGTEEAFVQLMNQ